MFNEHISLRRHGRRELDTFEVTSDQLDRLERSGEDVGFSFHTALFFLTVLLANIVNLLLSTVPPPGWQQTLFIVITVVSFILGVIFGIIAYRQRGERSRIFREIRTQPEIGPLGDEAHEVRQTELAHLPLQAAPPLPPAPVPPEPAPAASVQTEATAQLPAAPAAAGAGAPEPQNGE